MVQDFYFLFFHNISQMNLQSSLEFPELTLSMHINRSYSFNSSNNSTGVELEVTIRPAAQIKKHFQIDSQGNIEQQESIPQNEDSYEEVITQKKERAQQLLKKKGQLVPEYHQKHQITKNNEKRTQNPARRQINFNRSTQELHERERTRDNKKRQQSPMPIKLNPKIRHEEEKVFMASKKISFMPKFNELDGIYSVYDQCYSLKSSSSPGFMIVNEFSCSRRQPSRLQLQVKLPNPSADDCGIGITYNPKNLIKANIKKNPVKRCMAYYFSRQILRVGESTFQANLQRTERKIYKFIVNPIDKLFMLVSRRGEILIKKMIPQEFIEQQLFVFLEIKNGGKIQIM